MKLDHLKSFIALALVALVIFSCEKENAIQKSQELDYQRIGIEHNKGLDFVFEYLKKEKAARNSQLKGDINYIALSQKGVTEFINSNNLFINETEQKIAINESKKPFDFYQECTNNNLKSSTLTDLWTDDVEHLLTEKQKNILIKLNQILSVEKPEILEILDNISILEKEIESTCNVDEQKVLLIATSIASNSFQYWHDNFDKWAEEFGSDNDLKGWRDFRWSEAGKNDVAYGVGGGIAGAIVGGSVSVGVLTIPGYAAGAIGGAVGGSIGNAILQVWSSQAIDDSKLDEPVDLGSN